MFSTRSVATSILASLVLSQNVMAAPALGSAPVLRPWTAQGSPMEGLVRRNDTGDNSDDLSSVEEVCHSHIIDDDDPNTYNYAWDETTAAEFLEQWLVDNDFHDWVRRMDSDLMKTDSNRDCSFADSCDDPGDCAMYVERDAAPLYWILKAASTAHEGFTYLHEKLQDNTIIDSLNIDQMVSDLGADGASGGSTVFGSIAAGMTMAAGLTAGPAPEVSALITIMVGAFSLAAANQGDAVDHTAEIKVQMASIFQATQDQIEATCNLALKGDGDVSTLPNQSGPWSTHIAGFFDQGKFLANDISQQLDDVVDAAHEHMKITIIQAILKSQDFFIYVDDDMDEDECDEGGQVWADDKCFSLWTFTDDDITMAEDSHDGTWATLDNDYGWDFTTMYTESWKCAEDGRGEPDSNSVEFDGDYPVCFYNLPVVQGADHVEDGRILIVVSDGGINTSGRDSASVRPPRG